MPAMKPPYGDEGVRREIAKAQKDIDDYHDGNFEVLEKAKSHLMRLIMEVANRNEITPPVAEQLKIEVGRLTCLPIRRPE